MHDETKQKPQARTDRRLQNGANSFIKNRFQIILAKGRTLHILERCNK
jgi:septum formation topological specificity factor MinE